MTDSIAKLRELLAKATKGPWRCFDSIHGNSTIAIMKGDRPKVGRWKQIITWAGFDGTDVGKRYDRSNQELIVAAINVLPALLDRLETAEKDRHDLLKALGWKTDPFPDVGTRNVVMDDTAALRPEMVKARRRAQEAEGSALNWYMIAGERVEDARSGLLLRIWNRMRDEQRARRRAEARVAELSGEAI